MGGLGGATAVAGANLARTRNSGRAKRESGTVGPREKKSFRALAVLITQTLNSAAALNCVRLCRKTAIGFCCALRCAGQHSMRKDEEKKKHEIPQSPREEQRHFELAFPGARNASPERAGCS
ncbi:hypothetical protein AXG93_4875s1390 [Marchantia polymorpha subsp. ruderalis]|uniref:Uncharacterized protein n=1 Tax=Marchantia polymorpha subsp. ruderalis TaxID=1480154 RepID=A0A176WMW9_MARPO|nr:hypothetical protein AXG93_4875s1390 [Marchantia polymorpha subsp. ruderalis]